MKIAVLGSVATIIPPQGQAAIETLAFNQIKGLAEKGHQITAFALTGSKIKGQNIKLIEVGEGGSLSGLGKEGKSKAEEIYGSSYKMRLEITNLASLMGKLIELQDEYDLVLNNLRGAAVLVPFLDILRKPVYHILHLPLFPQLAGLFSRYHTRLISISDKQREVFPDLNYVGTVYNGVNTKDFSFSDSHDNYCLYLGSIGSNKNPKDAVLAAKKSNNKLMIGGRIKDKAYFDKEIAPHIDGKQIVWVGEKTKKEVISLYQKAKVFLFPTLWEEPFGLVLIEALSCGTPIIAYPNGAIPEIIENGKNGFLVKDLDSMVNSIGKISAISRKDCRVSVEKKFSTEKMIEQYEKVLSKN